MNNEHYIKDTDIKSETVNDEKSRSQHKNNTELVQIQDIKVENTCDGYMDTENNTIHHAVVKEDINFGTENSFNLNLNIDENQVNTIEFVSIKTETKHHFETEESSLDHNFDPIPTKDGKYVYYY